MLNLSVLKRYLEIRNYNAYVTDLNQSKERYIQLYRTIKRYSVEEIKLLLSYFKLLHIKYDVDKVYVKLIINNKKLLTKCHIIITSTTIINKNSVVIDGYFLLC